jgi:N-acyl-L-homoserine lactone synthetase
MKNDYTFSKVDGEIREKAVELHYKRYQEVGFIKRNEQDIYAQDSVYFAAQTKDLERVVGVTRLIFKELDDLPTMKEFSIYNLERVKLSKMSPTEYAEISAFTKMPQHDVGLGLIREVLRYSVKHGLTHWICCIDERVYGYMHRMFKFPFEMIGDKKVYLGSVSVPCALNIEECLQTLKGKRPALYDYFVLGQENIKEMSK